MNVEKGNLNTIGKDQLDKIIKTVLTDMSDTVAHTLGPSGGNTLVTEYTGNAPVLPSKDGFRLMQNMRYDNLVYDTIYRIVRDISSRMNIEVGDGTTSGIVIAENFYSELREFISHNKITPYGAKNLLEYAENRIIELLEKNYVQKIDGLSDDEKTEIYRSVGTISGNNDSRIGDIVAGIFAKTHTPNTFVNVEISETDETVIIDDMGFEFPAGHIHPSMATEPDGQTAEYDNPKFLLIDGPLTGNDVTSFVNYIDSICIQSKMVLVIVASEYSQEIMNVMIQARLGVTTREGSFYRPKIIALMVNSFNEIGKERLEDLRIALGATPLPTKEGRLMDAPKPSDLIAYLGAAKKIKTVPFYCRISKGNGNKEEIKDRIQKLKKDLEKYVIHDSMTSQERIATLQKRVAMLSSEMASIKVGGKTYKEKIAMRYLYEDAVCAVRSSVEHGITLGGNVSVSFAVRDNFATLIDTIADDLHKKKINIIIGNDNNKIKGLISELIMIISKSFLSAYTKVLYNAFGDDNDEAVMKIIDTIEGSSTPVTYNIMSNEYQAILNKDLIVPGNTDTELIRAVFSVVSTFITSNQLMTLHTEKKTV